MNIYPKPIDSSEFVFTEKKDGIYSLSYKTLLPVGNGAEVLASVTIPNVVLKYDCTTFIDGVITFPIEFEQLDNTDTIYEITIVDKEIEQKYLFVRGD